MEDDKVGDFVDDDTGAMEDLDLGEDRGSFGEDYSSGGLISLLLQPLSNTCNK
jgi:hypothetical protein